MRGRVEYSGGDGVERGHIDAVKNGYNDEDGVGIRHGVLDVHAVHHCDVDLHEVIIEVTLCVDYELHLVLSKWFNIVFGLGDRLSFQDAVSDSVHVRVEFDDAVSFSDNVRLPIVLEQSHAHQYEIDFVVANRDSMRFFVAFAVNLAVGFGVNGGGG